MYTTMHILKKVHVSMIFLICQYSNEHRAQCRKGPNITSNAKNFNLKNSFVFHNSCVTNLCQMRFTLGKNYVQRDL